jgi:hypothetical protein
MKLYVICVGKAVHYVVLSTRENYRAFVLQFARDAVKWKLAVQQRLQRCYMTRKHKLLCKRRGRILPLYVESSWNVMAHGDAREGKWKGNWRMEWVASTLHTTSEHGVAGITTADAHTSAASSRLNWRPRWFKWTHPFCRKTKFVFCACAITFQTQSTWWALSPKTIGKLTNSTNKS